jgi:5-oxoprolinase (ATP-hydrolysing)
MCWCLDNFEYIDQRIARLAGRCRDSLLERGFRLDQIHTEPYLHMRYDRTDCALLCEPANCDSGSHQTSLYRDFMKSFIDK